MVTKENNYVPHPGTICFYGAGSMAEAMVRGLIHKQVASPGSISMLNRSNQERLVFLTQQYGVVTSNQPEQKNKLLSEASIIVLAMKPKDVKEAITSIAPYLTDKQLIVSVITGLSIATIQKLLGFQAPIARTMPNTSSSIGYGATGISFSDEVSSEQQQQVLTMFEAVGTVSVIPEEKLEILTGVSGSGPAYIYFMMEAMIAAGMEGGLSAQQARDLTVQTVLGAAVMMRETGEDPAKLRAAITSPNGTTQAALDVLREGNFTETVKAAVRRAEERSNELGQAVKEALQ
ncbi:pyrroline-5-carboxylate reductase [Paenibacillus aceti]|uniref:Pyrroline-5-carboxylate reductase n=1 Tax=Paenibacillus aceti TaxID=1820010 RepID=A0ABQ1W2N1_9BACL|nr:pyrroline-5-carboxylate reductase [Paenibacillus aceti]GGG11912.1 pyrroline-5-carboxylate reductase [Paenibacillus aceti]